MTELERHLTTALRALSAQYEREQTRQAAQVEQRAEQVAALPAAGGAARRCSDALERGIQDAGRDVARAVEMMSRRAPERRIDRGFER